LLKNENGFFKKLNDHQAKGNVEWKGCI
jgi:hypothetical protein